MLLCLAVLLVFVIGKYRSELKLRAERIYWAHRCANHVTPPGTVLVEEDPAKAVKLVASNPDYVFAGQQWKDFGSIEIVFPPNIAVYWPEDFRQYYKWQPMPVSHSGGTRAVAFMGERVSPSGNHRLVVIPVWELNKFSMKEDLQTPNVLPLPDVFGNISPIQRPLITMNYSGAYFPIYLLPGVADPVDRSHISIGFTSQFGGTQPQSFVDIFLRDDDSLDVKFRDPAATQP